MNDYVVYLQESDFDVGINKYLVLFSQAIENDQLDKLIDAMKYELKSMEQNDVWDLVKLLEGYERVRYKWTFNTKRDSKGNIER